MAEIIQLLEKSFEENGYGRVEMPPKPGIHPGDGNNFIHAMPAYIPTLKSVGIKWVSDFPENVIIGLPNSTRLIIINDPETGIPLAVMDCMWISAMRTAAASVVAAKRLARPEASRLGILGCGVQGRTYTEALNVLFPVSEVLAYDVLPEVAEKFDLKITPVQTP
jgi:ornithine cyclodeaminase/alanine dehydrogenase